MLSPAGEMDLRIEGIDVRAGELVIAGRMGVWDATIRVSPSEVREMVSMAPKWRLVRLLFRDIGRGRRLRTANQATPAVIRADQRPARASKPKAHPPD